MQSQRSLLALDGPHKAPLCCVVSKVFLRCFPAASQSEPGGTREVLRDWLSRGSNLRRSSAQASAEAAAVSPLETIYEAASGKLRGQRQGKDGERVSALR
ncbi:unnamed protein product [Arctogadus glacialis]